MAAMYGHLFTMDGATQELSPASVERLVASSTPFWLDLLHPDDKDVQALLRDTFGFHPLALEDAAQFGQRPKLDSYDDYSLLVAYGPNGEGHLTELHCFLAENYLVTLHHQPLDSLAGAAQRLQVNAASSPVMLLYRVVGSLIDGYFPVLASVDDQIDELEDEILQKPTDEQLGRLFDMKRSLIAMRKVVTPQRDVFATLLTGPATLSGMTAESERYFRDLYDHLIRVSDLVDSYRDLMTGALDTHLSTVSNRLNAVMKQLTIIATIFLPLSFLTGFFGQNFGWMIARLSTLPVFLGVAIGLQVATVVALVVFFRARGWLSSDGTVPPAVPARRMRVATHARWLTVHTPPGRGQP
jgi:magnesium transporter